MNRPQRHDGQTWIDRVAIEGDELGRQRSVSRIPPSRPSCNSHLWVVQTQLRNPKDVKELYQDGTPAAKSRFSSLLAVPQIQPHETPLSPLTSGNIRNRHDQY